MGRKQQYRMIPPTRGMRRFSGLVTKAKGCFLNATKDTSGSNMERWLETKRNRPSGIFSIPSVTIFTLPS